MSVTLPPNSRLQKPYNIYYTISYYKPFFYAYGPITSFTFAWIADYLLIPGKACLWTGWVITYALLIATHPSIYTDRERSDEVGKLVRVRRPLIGLKRCEVALDVDGINNGLYDAVHGLETS